MKVKGKVERVAAAAAGACIVCIQSRGPRKAREREPAKYRSRELRLLIPMYVCVLEAVAIFPSGELRAREFFRVLRVIPICVYVCMCVWTGWEMTTRPRLSLKGICGYNMGVWLRRGIIVVRVCVQDYSVVW